MIRLLFLLEDKDAENKLTESVPDLGISRSFSDLMSHRDEMMNSPERIGAVDKVRRETEKVMHKMGLAKYLPRNLKEFVKLSGKVCFCRLGPI